MKLPNPDHSLRAHNTLGLESIAEAFARVASADHLAELLGRARHLGRPVLALGEGSNLVLGEYVPGLVLLIDLKGKRLLWDDGRQLRLRVAAGENWHDLVTWCCLNGFHGLENLALIPGSVGAAPVQNIGAYGVEVCERVDGVQVVNVQTGETTYLDNSDCAFNYRDSIFKSPAGRQLIITAVDLRLDRQAPLNIEYPSLKVALPTAQPDHRTVFDTVTEIRRSRLPDPVLSPNVGSFFKNPIVPDAQAAALKSRYPDLVIYPAGPGSAKLSAAWMIDHLGWRGRECGGVAVSEKHSLVLVNRSATSAAAVLRLADAISEDVAASFELELEIEPELRGVQRGAVA